MLLNTKVTILSAFAALIVIGAFTCGFYSARIESGVAGKWILTSAKGNYIYAEQLTQPTGHASLSKVNSASSANQKYQTTKNFTIVTAYFKIGYFQKGYEQVTRGPSTYLDWMWSYRSILNGVVAYFDDPALAAEFAELRKNRPTKVVIVDRSQLWAFSLLNRTSAVFMQADYPKNSPKSTIAEYVAAMHAKYELVARAAQGDDPFRSTYIAWMDLGIYRELPKNTTNEFMLDLHGCHRDEAILFARVRPMLKDDTLESVMRNGKDWVGGGFFVARHEVAIRFFGDYVRSVELYLNQSLANHDQSVLLAMYLPTTGPRPSVPLQAIIPPGTNEQWFYLALLARKAALAKLNATNELSANLVECSYNIHL